MNRVFILKQAVIKKEFLNTWFFIQSNQLYLNSRRSVLGLFLFLLFAFPVCLPAQCTMICRSSLNLSLPADGESIITPEILLANPACDPAEFYVEIFDNQGNTLGDKITCDEVGQTLNAGVFHQVTGVSCWTMISVSDYIKPQLTCKDTLISCISDYSVSAIGSPIVTDNCEVASLTYTEDFTTRDCFYTNPEGDTITAELVRIWTATDVNGNTNSCTQFIYLKRSTVDEVVFPANRDDLGLPALDCSQDPQDLTLTGEPTIENLPLLTGGHCELIVSFTDQSIEFCGPGGYRVLRNWRVVDYCTGNFKEHIQIIKVADKTAPEMTCISDIQEFTDTYSCDATILLPTMPTTDDCSSVTITPSWAYGSGFGPFENIPVGSHEITYTASDECGNTSTCMVTLTVTDNIIPAMVCEGNTQVALTTNGEAIILAMAFDDGSHDNCQIDRFEVSRDNQNYAAQVPFDCADVNAPVLISLRAYDIYGNFNTCEISVNVVDGIKPVIACPIDVTIACKADYEDLNITGLPVVLDACGIDTFYYTDDVEINSCHVGRVVRTWRAIDVSGNEKICQQQIFIEDNTVFGVSFPSNYQSFECGADLSPVITGEPILTNHNCEEVSIVSNDIILPISAPACLRILREWTVVNWCEYDLNSGSTDGYYTYTQEIILSDSIAPEINCYNDTIVGVYSANCGAALVSLPMVVAQDCSDSIKIENNSPYAFSTGANASGNYPIGTHQIVYTASDGCGNATTCSVQVIVEDAQAPSVYCVGNITLSVDNQGFVVISPEMLDLGSFDNCTDSANLIFSIDRDTFTCSDVGTQEVTLSVTDENGNHNSCTTTVVIQNNVAICPVTSVALSGKIAKENGGYVEGFWVYLSGDKVDSVQTDGFGNYTFLEVPVGGDYEVKPYNNNNITNGVNTLDLVFLIRHLLEINTLDSPYRKIASDINESKTISSLDIISMRRAILVIDTLFSRTDSWKFVDAGFDFSNVPNPVRADYQEKFEILDLQENLDTLDFIAVKMGDLNDNGSAQPLTVIGDTREGSPEVNLMIKDQNLEKGTVVEIPVLASSWESVVGLQFTIEVSNAVTLLDVKLSESAEKLGWTQDNFGKDQLAKGFLKGSWTNNDLEDISEQTALFFLKVAVHESTMINDILKLTDEYLKTEAYTGDWNENIETGPLKLVIESLKSIEKTDTEPLAIYPNPVKDFVHIEFLLPIESEIRWEAYDIMGRKVGQGNDHASAGKVEMVLSRNVLGGEGGPCYLKITQVATNKIINATIMLME